MKRTRSGYLKKYAEAEGISRQVAARQLKKVGEDYSKAFDFSAAKRKVAASRHASRAKSRKSPAKGAIPVEPLPQSSAIESFADAQRRKEIAKADQAELQFERASNAVVEREPLNKWLFEVIRTFRDKVLSVPDRVVGMVSAETNQHKNHALLTKELHAILEELSDSLTAFAGGDP